jgi:hypothetical protein
MQKSSDARAFVKWKRAIHLKARQIKDLRLFPFLESTCITRFERFGLAHFPPSPVSIFRLQKLAESKRCTRICQMEKGHTPHSQVSKGFETVLTCENGVHKSIYEFWYINISRLSTSGNDWPQSIHHHLLWLNPTGAYPLFFCPPPPVSDGKRRDRGCPCPHSCWVKHRRPIYLALSCVGLSVVTTPCWPGGLRYSGILTVV